MPDMDVSRPASPGDGVAASPQPQPPSRKASLNTMPPEVIDAIGYYVAISSPGSRFDPIGSNSPPLGNASSRPESSAAASAFPLASLTRTDFGVEEPPAYATPPSQLISLLLTCRYTYELLNSEASPRLYSRIFKTKFDDEAIARRHGIDAIDPVNLTQELKKRCRLLKRIRATVRGGRVRRPRLGERESQMEMEENLWLAYLMMLENGESRRPSFLLSLAERLTTRLA